MEDEVLAILERQHGVIGRRQALSVGWPKGRVDRRVASGEWIRFASGVYRHRMRPRSWRGDLVAACLITDGLASHRAAAALRSLRPCVPGIVEVVVPRGSVRSASWMIVHESKQFALADPTMVDGIPTTGLARTVLDLSAVVDRRMIEEVVDALLVDRRLSLRDLVDVRHRHSRRGRDGCGFLREVLDDRLGEVGVPLSRWSRLVADLLVEGHLPRPVFEHRVAADGFFIAQVDLAYPDLRVGIELDSVRWHLNREAFERDANRRNRLTTAGWTILTFTWDEYRNNPAGVVRTVRAARARSGR